MILITKTKRKNYSQVITTITTITTTTTTKGRKTRLLPTHLVLCLIQMFASDPSSKLSLQLMRLAGSLHPQGFEKLLYVERLDLESDLYRHPLDFEHIQKLQ